MEPRGAGALQLAFEQLKADCLQKDSSTRRRKRPLPAFPKCIGIITSPAGAVIRDIVTIVRRRHARLNLLVYPATMQGASSPDSVAAGNPLVQRKPIARRCHRRWPAAAAHWKISRLQRRSARARDRRLVTSGRLRHRPRDRLHDCRLRRRSARCDSICRRRTDHGRATPHRRPRRGPCRPRTASRPLSSDACATTLRSPFGGIRSYSSARCRQPS